MAGLITPRGASPFLRNFQLIDAEIGPDQFIRAAIGGSGPPLLLLHGHPQNHATWHKIAPALAESFTVIAADLRGYGDSFKPPGGDNHIAYSKRHMAQDQVTLMRMLGHARFAVAGHDRGARVAHRMALDFPEAVERVAMIDIAPTATMYGRTNQAFATAYFWWFLLIQPYPLPEKFIGADPEYFLRYHLERKLKIKGSTTPEIFAEYLRCYSDATRHAICEDYRAAATIDLIHDSEDADKKIIAPLMAIWGGLGTVGKLYDVLETWREKALQVEGRAFNCGHTLQEEMPEETLAALLGFFRREALAAAD